MHASFFVTGRPLLAADHPVVPVPAEGVARSGRSGRSSRPTSSCSSWPCRSRCSRQTAGTRSTPTCPGSPSRPTPTSRSGRPSCGSAATSGPSRPWRSPSGGPSTARAVLPRGRPAVPPGPRALPRGVPGLGAERRRRRPVDAEPAGTLAATGRCAGLWRRVRSSLRPMVPRQDSPVDVAERRRDRSPGSVPLGREAVGDMAPGGPGDGGSMSLAWKVTVTVVLFAVAAVGGRRPHREPRSGTPPDRRLHGRQAPASRSNVTLQTVGTYGSGSHPTWVSYLVQSPAGPVGAHDALPGARSTSGSTSPSTSTTRAARCATSSSARSPAPRERRPRSTASRSGSSTPTPATASATRSRSRRSASTCPLYGNNGNANLCAAAPVHHQARRTKSSSSPSPARARAATAGSASCPAGWATSTATAGPMSTLGYMGGFMKVVA